MTFLTYLSPALSPSRLCFLICPSAVWQLSQTWTSYFHNKVSLRTLHPHISISASLSSPFLPAALIPSSPYPLVSHHSHLNSPSLAPASFSIHPFPPYQSLPPLLPIASFPNIQSPFLSSRPTSFLSICSLLSHAPSTISLYSFNHRDFAAPATLPSGALAGLAVSSLSQVRP